EILLGSAQTNAEAGNHLVENQRDAELVAQSTQPRQKPFFRKDAAVIAHDRLGDDSCNFRVPLRDRFSDQLRIVPWQDNKIFPRGFRQSIRPWKGIRMLPTT